MTLPTTIDGAVYEPPPKPPAPIDTAPRFASVGERLGSAIVDCLVAALLSIPLIRAEGESRGAAFSWIVIIWAIWFVYLFVAYRRWGQTPGKWALRTRLVSADGGPLSDRQIVVRIGFFIAIGMLLLPGYWQALGLLHGGSYGEPSWVERQALIEELTPAWGDVIIGSYFLFMAGCAIAILLSSRKQSLHDMVAGTVVVSLRAPASRAQAATIGRWHRVLEVADWTLATLLATAALFFLLGAWGTTQVPEGSSADDATMTLMLYLAGGAAVLAALMLLAALNVRSTNRGKRAFLHWLAYVLTFAPIGVILLGLALQMNEGSETLKSSVPDVVQITPVNRA